ncbi:MAG: hypothetical protein ACXWV1_06605 [Chitinophagaceae bacterium]
MKESMAYLQDSTALVYQPCSEHMCITCFENKGCIYDHYVAAIMQEADKLQVSKQDQCSNSILSQQA